MALGGPQKSGKWAWPGRGSQGGCRLGTAEAPALIWGRSPPQGAGTNTQPASQPATHPPTQPPTQLATHPARHPPSHLPSHSAIYPATQPPTQPASHPATQPPTQPSGHPPSNHAATRGTYLTHETQQPTSLQPFQHWSPLQPPCWHQPEMPQGPQVPNLACWAVGSWGQVVSRREQVGSPHSPWPGLLSGALPDPP